MPSDEGKTVPGAAKRKAPLRLKALPVIALLVLHAGLLGYGAWVHSPTVDEASHLSAGVYNWDYGRHELDRANPPLVGLVGAAPVLLAGPETDWIHVPHTFTVCVDFLKANGPRSCRLVTLGRWPCILAFSVTGGYFCFRWAAELYGYASGLLALALWCFSPNVIGHGQLITGDVAATATGIAAFTMFWRWLCRPSLGRATFAGLFLGLAELAKMVWVVLFVLWPILWVVWRVLGRRDTARLSLLREAGHLAVMLALCLYVINLGYGFDSPFQPLGSFPVGERILKPLVKASPDGDTAGADAGTRGRRGKGKAQPGGDAAGAGGVVAWLRALPVPLPANYVAGIGEIGEIHDLHNATYLRRQSCPDGWWYYYPYALLVKMPLGTLGLLGLAWILPPFLPQYRTQWRTELLLLLTVATILCFINHFGVAQRLRYGLPVLPFLLIWASKNGILLARWHRIFTPVTAALLSWTVLSSLWIYPHSLSYFNELTGGPFGGHAHLNESNISWGQDFLYLKGWMEEHPEASPLGLSWKHPLLDPRVLGIEYTEVPTAPAPGEWHSPQQLMQSAPLPGWYAIDVDRLRSWDLAYFFCLKPTATAGYSIYIYHVTLEDANRVRRQLGLPELEDTGDRQLGTG